MPPLTVDTKQALNKHYRILPRFCRLTVSADDTCTCHAECTDYRIDENNPADLDYWDADKCFGRPRCAAQSVRDGFGGKVEVEGGGSKLSNQDPVAGSFCQCPMSQGEKEYQAGLPMAQYTPGQLVCVVRT